MSYHYETELKVKNTIKRASKSNKRKSNVSRKYRPRDEAAYNLSKQFLKMLTHPDKYFGMDLEDVRQHALLTKIYRQYVKTAKELGASLSFVDAEKDK
jgi:hypothetical protein